MTKRFRQRAETYLWQLPGEPSATPITQLTHEQLLRAVMSSIDAMSDVQDRLAAAGLRIDRWAWGKR